MPLDTEFDELLRGPAAEKPIQRFFERHPHLLVESSYVLAHTVVSQLRLGTEFRADFAFIEPTSGPTYLHLIELESPSLTFFTANDEFTAQFNHAAQQVRDWTVWGARHQNELSSLFAPLYYGTGETKAGFFVVKSLLVVGRRNSISNVRRKERFESLSLERGGFCEVRTYDGLREKIESKFRTDPENEQGVRCVWYRGRRFCSRPLRTRPGTAPSK